MKQLIIGIILTVTTLSFSGCSDAIEIMSTLERLDDSDSRVSDGDRNQSEAETENETETESTAAATQTGETVSLNGTSDGVDPELKAFMDRYEEAMIEYGNFTEKFNNASGVEQAKLIAEYTVVTTEFFDLADKVEAIDEEELSDQDIAYVAEVQSRVEQRLQEVLG